VASAFKHQNQIGKITPDGLKHLCKKSNRIYTHPYINSIVPFRTNGYTYINIYVPQNIYLANLVKKRMYAKPYKIGVYQLKK
jgi:hypothetical protein